MFKGRRGDLRSEWRVLLKVDVLGRNFKVCWVRKGVEVLKEKGWWRENRLEFVRRWNR